MKKIRAWWDRVTEPRRLKAAYVVIYAVTACAGLTMILTPPATSVGGEHVAVVWSWLFLLGGIVGVASVFPGWWWLERILAIAPILGGLVIMFTATTILHADTSQSANLGVTVIAAAPFLLRFLVIREFSYEPRR